MKRAANWTVGLILLLLTGAGAAFADEDLTAMAAGVKDYRTKFRLIAKGRDAIAPLMAQVDSKDASLAFESKSALRWIALHARRQGAEADAIARDVEAYAKFESKHSGAVKAFAAELLGDLGSPDSTRVLEPHVLHSSEAVARAAVDALRRLPGDTAREMLTVSLKGTGGWLRTAIFRALGARAEPESLPLLLEWARAGQAGAILALGDGAYADAEEVLVTLCREQNPAAFPALLRIAEAQADTAMLARLFEYAQNDAEALAVIKAATGRCVKEGELVEKLGRAMERPALKAAAQQALLSSCGCFSRRMKALMGQRILGDAANDAITQQALAVIGQSGDEKSAEVVIPFLLADKPSVRTTAIVALGGIPGRRATQALMDTFKQEADPAVQSLLIRMLRERGAIEAVDLITAWMPSAPAKLKAQAGEALLHIAELSGEGAAARIHLKLLAMGVKEPALRGLAKSGDASAVPAIEAALEGASDVERVAAIDALTAIGVRLAKAGDKAGALVALRAALRAGAMVENHLRKLGESIEIVARRGLVSAWWILGPFPAPDQTDWPAEIIPPSTVRAPATIHFPDGDRSWLPVQVGGPNAIVDLDGLLTPNEQVVAFAFAEIYVRKERAAVLKTGSDDGLIVWVNGQKVHEKLVLRGLSVDEDTVPVQLKEGKNTLVLKICEAGGGWGFCARLEDEKGRPLKFRIR